MARERAYLQSAELLRVQLAVKEDEAPGPVDVGLLCPVREVQRPDAVPQPVEQPHRRGGAWPASPGQAERDSAIARPFAGREFNIGGGCTHGLLGYL